MQGADVYFTKMALVAVETEGWSNEGTVWVGKSLRNKSNDSAVVQIIKDSFDVKMVATSLYSYFM